jgi:hypothetical protein
MERYQDYYQTALNMVSREFSSNEFANILKKNKAPRNAIAQQVNFLYSNCIKGETRRTWTKKEKQTSSPVEILQKKTRKRSAVIESPNQYRTFNLFWGLLKFNY